MSTLKKLTPKSTLNTDSEHDWRTVLFNCYCHSQDEVLEQLMKALKCSSDTASKLMQVAETMGSVTVFRGDQEYCGKVADVLGATGLVVDVTN